MKGVKVQGERLHVDQFRSMLKVTLDINPPDMIIRTPHGDLIRDPTYQGKMYLRQLLLPSGGARGKAYQYGYNFLNGAIDRDRESLNDPKEESEQIAATWASGIRADDSEDSDLLTEYTDLIVNSLTKKGDAMLSVEANCLLEDIANKVWGRMKTMNQDLQLRRPPFYYSATEGKDEVHIIEQSLNKNHVPIASELWDMLRKFDLSRTPTEELLHRFKFAKPVAVPDTNFAKHISYMLSYLLRSFKATEKMKVN